MIVLGPIGGLTDEDRQLLQRVIAATGDIEVKAGPPIIEGKVELVIVSGDIYGESTSSAINVTVVDPRLPTDLLSDGTIAQITIDSVRGHGSGLVVNAEIKTYNSELSTAVVAISLTSEETGSLRRGHREYAWTLSWHIGGDPTQQITSISRAPLTVIGAGGG